MSELGQLVRRRVPGRGAALAVAAGIGTTLSGVALLATSGALLSGAAEQPETLLVLMPLITGVRALGLARPVLRYLERLVAHDVTLRLVGGLRTDLLERLVPLAPAALTGSRGGDLLARIRSDVDTLQGVFVQLVAPAVVAVCTGGMAVAVTALVSAPLALVLAGLLLALGALLPAVSARAGAPAAVERDGADAAFGSDVLDLVRGLPDHLAADRGGTALRRLDADLAGQDEAERREARLGVVLGVLRDSTPALGVVAALLLVGQDVARGTTNHVLLAASALGVLGAFEAVSGLGTAWASSGGMQAAARRVRALGHQQPAVTDPPRPVSIAGPIRLQFADVDFTYPGAASPALRHVDLMLRAGEKVALTGPSGAGKSSVLALALRIWDPDAGTVCIGGTDLRRLRLEDVRACFAWEPQVPQLLGGTLAGNLRLSRPEATDADLESALRDVALDDVLATLGLDGWIGESGQRLSAGERARVAVARALLSPAPVLLLDEPTAHLDGALAVHVLDLLAADPRPVLLVTHAATALSDAWQVVAMPRAGDVAALPA